MVTRPEKDLYYLNIAKEVSKRSTCLRRRYGAVIVKNDEIISTGYNGSPRGTKSCIENGSCKREMLNIPKGERYELCKAVHAEQNAIISAARKDMIDSTIYIYGTDSESSKVANPTPCNLCIRFIINAGIKRIVGMFSDVVYKEIDIENIYNEYENII